MAPPLWRQRPHGSHQHGSAARPLRRGERGFPFPATPLGTLPQVTAPTAGSETGSAGSLAPTSRRGASERTGCLLWPQPSLHPLGKVPVLGTNAAATLIPQLQGQRGHVIRVGSQLHLLYGPERKGEEDRGEHWQKYCHWPLSRLLARGDNTAAFVRPLLCKWIRLTAEQRLLPAPETTFPLAQVRGHCWTWQPLSDGSVVAASLLFLLSGTWGQTGPWVTWLSSPQGPRCRASPRGCSRRLGGR